MVIFGKGFESTASLSYRTILLMNKIVVYHFYMLDDARCMDADSLSLSNLYLLI